MAKLKNMKSGDDFYLLPYHSIGRRQHHVDSYFDAVEVSNIHAVIEWTGQHWCIKDHSRNGTWIDGVKLETSRKTPLSVGQVISFACPETHYLIVVDLAPPQALLTREEHEIPLKQYNLLPSEERPEMALYQRENSSRWYYERFCEETQGEVGILEHGQVISFSDQQWTAFLPKQDQYTKGVGEDKIDDLRDFQFIFQVSLDEESVSLLIKNGQREVSMGTKAFFGLLVYLARKRIEDCDAGLIEEDQGWVSTAVAVRDVGLEENHMNIHIYRLRSYLSNQLPEFRNKDIVLDRGRRGSIRIGIPADKLIVKGGAIQYQRINNATDIPKNMH